MDHQEEIKAFQRAAKVPEDGSVGPVTWDRLKTAYVPARPSFAPHTEADKLRIFGDPLGGRAMQPEEQHFVPAQSFLKNIHSIEVPAWFKPTMRVDVHALAARSLQSMIADWSDAGLARCVTMFCGSVAYRRIRGGTHLSAHAFGTAFDINAIENPLGGPLAMPWQKGCVFEMVKIANAHRWYWGGHFRRIDGMHFEFVGEG